MGTGTPINKANKTIRSVLSFPMVDEPDDVDEDFDIPDEDIALNSLSCVSLERDTVRPITTSKAVYVTNSPNGKSNKVQTNMSMISKTSTSIASKQKLHDTMQIFHP